MNSSSKAVIVWIDDHFLTPTFNEDVEKNAWHKLFGKINSNLYRLLDINIKFIRTAKEAEDFILYENRFKSNVYYYFIVDRKLPYNIGDESVDSNSEFILKYLLSFQKRYNTIDFSVLSSGSPDSYAIKNINYHLKPQNKEFSLPDELRHLILFKIKENIVFIDQDNLNIEKQLKYFGDADFIKFKDQKLIYPFIGKYKSFVELEEVSKKDFNTLIVLSPNSTSDQFILQNLYITLYDHLKDYDGLNYYKDENYNRFKINGYFDGIMDLTSDIPIIRFKKWNILDYTTMYKYLKYKHIKVFIIDSFDDNISNYIDLSSNIKTIKVDTINNDTHITEKILFSMLSKYLNSLDFDISETVYYKNNILLLHPLFYRIILDLEIKIDQLDDPSEIIQEVDEYLKLLELKNIGDGNKTKQNILNSLPIEINTDILYEKIKILCGDQYKYNNLLFNTLKFWLTHSWNVNYNIDFDNAKNLEAWQKYSFNILYQLIRQIDLNCIKDDRIKDFKQIKDTVLYFVNNDNVNLISTAKILWPYEKYPMPSYMLNYLHDNSNKKLYIQDKNLNFIDDSIELENSFQSLEYKIQYYRTIFKLIEDTYNYLPPEIGQFIYSISQRIQDNKDIFITKDNKLIGTDKEDFKKLANILFRITINFGMLISDLDIKKLSYKRDAKQPFAEDLAGLGKLVSDIRDHIYNKIDIFNYENSNLTCSSYINSDNHKNFMLNNIKILDNNNVKKLIEIKEKDLKLINSIDLNKNIKPVDNIVIIQENYDIENIVTLQEGEESTEKTIIEINKKISKQNKDNAKINKKNELPLVKYIYKDINSSYLNKLFISNNITTISQISNISSYLTQNEHNLKIQKHKGAYNLFAYLADTRNTWEHGDDKAWNRELFIESFIYGYESIWLMQKYILENIYNFSNLPNTNYVKLNKLTINLKESRIFKQDFKEFNDYNSYFSKMYDKSK